MTTRAQFTSALEDILSVPRGQLQETDTRDTVPGWSSIVDVQILAYISSEFGVEPDAELLAADSIGDLIRTLEERQALA
jgi:acyl carrier protein